MKFAPLAIVISALVIGGAIIFSERGGASSATPTVINTSIVDGTQIIEINAKGGYSPRMTIAKANIPTVLTVKTQGTFDCSAALSIPALNYRTNLLPSGETKIEIPPQKAGTTLQGLC